VKLRTPDWSFDEKELAAAFGQHTKAIILNTPNNPTGKVFTRAELEFIRDLCVRWNAYCITDEIYEHILYDGAEHISMARIDGMRDRTIVINGLSKTYSVTGWRVGWVLGAAGADATDSQSARFSDRWRRCNRFSKPAPAPCTFPPSYYDKLAASYTAKRERLLKILTSAGFTPSSSRGARTTS